MVMTHAPNALLPFTAAQLLASLRTRMARDAGRSAQLGVAMACRQAFVNLRAQSPSLRDKGTVIVRHAVTPRRVASRAEIREAFNGSH